MIDPILEFLEERYGYAPPPRLYTPIGEARAWWGGTWDPFHMTTEHHAGLAPRRREMYKMGMAKKICEDWATVLCNDKTRITTGDAALDRVLFGGDGGQDGVLTQGRFRGRLHAFTEQVFALGTGAAVVTPAGAEYDDGDMLVRAEGMAVDFLPADQIVPLQIENGEIVKAQSPLITTQCLRVPVSDGHTAAVFVKFENKPSEEEIKAAWAEYKGVPQELDLPHAPKQFLNYFEDPDRPQAKIDRNLEGLKAGEKVKVYYI